MLELMKLIINEFLTPVETGESAETIILDNAIKTKETKITQKIPFIKPKTPPKKELTAPITGMLKSFETFFAKNLKIGSEITKDKI